MIFLYITQKKLFAQLNIIYFYILIKGGFLMADSYIQKLFSERIGGKRFGKDLVLSAKDKIELSQNSAVAEHPEFTLIDFSSDEPDAMADYGVIEELSKQAGVWENRIDLSCTNKGFAQATQEYMKNVFGVDNLNAETEITFTAGIKSAIFTLIQSFVDNGDVVISVSPENEDVLNAVNMAGGEAYILPLCEDNGFMPDLDAIPEETVQKAKVLYINYSNNPAGTAVNEKFFRKAVRFAKKNKIVLINNAAFSAVTFDGTKPVSLLNINGAKDVGIELHSFSYAFNMSGWSVGFAAGNQLIIKAVGSFMAKCGYGKFGAEQAAAEYALRHTEITEQTVQKYSRRLDMLVSVLKKSGFKVKKPKASMFLYTKAPAGIKDGVKFKTSYDFCQWLLNEKLIAAVPYNEFGNSVRFSATFLALGENEEKTVMESVAERLDGIKFEF